MGTTGTRTRWRYGVLAAAAVTVIALAPQIFFCLGRGGQWNGSYAQTHGDESVYAAYLNAIIDGRPRRTNPYSGRDDTASQPAAESYLSVQFFPLLLIANVARTLHLSTAQSFIALTAIIAFGAALAVFWLLALVLQDDRLAAIGVLVVLLATSSNLVIEYLLRLEDSNNYLPFLRRYLPAVPFPILFVYCGMVWRMLRAPDKRKQISAALLAGLLFVSLTFSYAYHWTFALVWTICFAGVWLGLKPQERRRSIASLTVLGAFMFAAVAVYLFLATKLGATTAEIHFLAHSHAPDPFRLTEIIAFIVLAVLVLLIVRKRVAPNEPLVIFAIASALTPPLLFNQQILTGRSLQPFHYDVFVGSYFTMMAAFLCVILCWRRLVIGKQRLAQLLLAGATAAAILSGCAQATLLSRRQKKGNIFSDEARPALLRLAALGHSDSGSLDTTSVVYAPNFIVSNAVPSTAPQPVLWGEYLFVFPDVTLAEDKERLAEFLYYKGVSFSDIDRNHFASLDNERGYYLSSLMRRGRFNPRLSVDWTPITPDEVQAALDYYANFIATFDRSRATQPQISYLLIAADDPPNLSNFDRWYERDAGERVGKYVLFRVRLKN
ncbi:MAG TPA: hypothetical protein VLL54_10545 [Pyrinomonadaceae bacterium]|nr:hypothetical protein [Pyrinomonadaceae bacterium]